MKNELLKWQNARYRFLSFDEYKYTDCAMYIVNTLIKKCIFKKFLIQEKIQRFEPFYDINDHKVENIMYYNLENNLNDNWLYKIYDYTDNFCLEENDILMYSFNEVSICHFAVFITSNEIIHFTMSRHFEIYSHLQIEKFYLKRILRFICQQQQQ